MIASITAFLLFSSVSITQPSSLYVINNGITPLSDSIVRATPNPRFKELSRDTIAGIREGKGCRLVRSYSPALGPGIAERVVEHNVTRCVFIVARGTKQNPPDTLPKNRKSSKF